MVWIRRTNYSLRMIIKTLKEFVFAFLRYYVSSYPFQLLIGALRRLQRRLRLIWVPKGRGRPPVSEEIIGLILDMKRYNPGWGALRISDELKLLGIPVSKIVVASILRKNGFLPPKTRVTPISWNAFFHHHKHIWAIDFTCVHDVFGNQVFIFVVLDVISRELVSINATLNPNKDWIIQQICNASIAGFKLPTAMIADNDGIYGEWLDLTFKELFEIEVFHIPPKQPWKNGRCERFHLSLKKEILRRIDLFEVDQIQSLCVFYQNSYNVFRPHQGLKGKMPSKIFELTVPKIPNTSRIKYRRIEDVNLLSTNFELAA
jgi:transposase InsO family protein